MQRTVVNPWQWSIEMGFNQGEVVEGASRVLFCAGQTAVDEAGAPQHAGDTPEFRYTTHGRGEHQVAGIMDATTFHPEGAPAEWSIYFGTEGTDATLARAVELGGAILVPAEDTPYGRLAQAADPTGVEFKLIAGG